MNIADLLDPELAPIFAALPELEDITADPHLSRQTAAAMILAAQNEARDSVPVTATDRSVPGPKGAPDVPLRIYYPSEPAAGGLLWLHGGGFILGDLDRADPFCRRMALEVGCVVASVAYRLAPENPFPAAVEDCYAALQWLASSAAELGLDSRRIAIGGTSAGGCLAAAVALMARDYHGPQLAFQLLLYPCLDDRHRTPSSHAITDSRTWNRQASLRAWQAYLGSDRRHSVSPYAAPSRAADLANLPPAYILAAELDLLRDENVEYASRLMQAGVRTELHVFPGTFHGFDGLAPATQIGRRARSEYFAATRDALTKQPQL